MRKLTVEVPLKVSTDEKVVFMYVVEGVCAYREGLFPKGKTLDDLKLSLIIAQIQRAIRCRAEGYHMTLRVVENKDLYDKYVEEGAKIWEERIKPEYEMEVHKQELELIYKRSMNILIDPGKFYSDIREYVNSKLSIELKRDSALTSEIVELIHEKFYAQFEELENSKVDTEFSVENTDSIQEFRSTGVE